MAMDLMGALRDFFVAEFDKGNPEATAAAGFVLSFEQFPITLSPEICLLDQDDPASYVPARQQEMITRLVLDHATLLTGGYRIFASEWVSDTYVHELLEPSRFLAEPGGDEEEQAEARARFLVLRKKAQDEFRTAVSVMGQPDEFAPTEALPSNWLDLRQDDNWLTYRFSASAKSPAPAPPGGSPPLNWRAVDASVLATVSLALDGGAPPVAAPPARRPGGARLLHLLGAVDLAASRSVGARAVVEAAPAPVPAVAPAFEGARMAKLRRLEAFGKTGGIDVAEFLRNQPARRELQFDRKRLAARADMADVLSQGVVETAPAPADDRIDVSFRYQVVRISRPWLFYPFLRHPGWFVAGMKAGGISNPAMPEAPGRMGLVPTALIVIRDLSITADWNERDIAELEKSFALGPFGKGTQARIVGQVLTCEGVQVIGVISERLPLLPPRSDPALESTP